MVTLSIDSQCDCVKTSEWTPHGGLNAGRLCTLQVDGAQCTVAVVHKVGFTRKCTIWVAIYLPAALNGIEEWGIIFILLEQIKPADKQSKYVA